MVFEFKKTDSHTSIAARDMGLGDLAAVVLFQIGTLYERLKSASPEAAKQFKSMIICGVSHPLSPVWKLQTSPHAESIVDVASIRIDPDELRRQMEAERE